MILRPAFGTLGGPELVLGRAEKTTDDNRFVRQWLKRWLPRVAWLWAYRYGPEKKGETETWNVACLYGRYGRWHTVSLEEWAGLGTAPFPHLVKGFVFQPAVDKIDPLEVNVKDPPIAHRVHEFFDDPSGRYERLSTRLENAGVLCGADPRTRTREGLDQVLAEAGLLLSDWDPLKIPQGTRPRGPGPGEEDVPL